MSSKKLYYIEGADGVIYESNLTLEEAEFCLCRNINLGDLGCYILPHDIENLLEKELEK